LQPQRRAASGACRSRAPARALALHDPRQRQPADNALAPRGDRRAEEAITIGKQGGSDIAALAEVFERMASGGAFDLIPEERALSTQEAANQLGMSRQYLVRLLDLKKLPSHKVGSHRRVKLADLQAYAALRDRDRRAAIDEMVKVSQDLGAAD
jgi:excisionase family DNA binding protein